MADTAAPEGFYRAGAGAELAEHDLKVDYRTMWVFVHAEKLSYKKRCCHTRVNASKPRYLTAAGRP
jgi:putative transposase